MPLPPALSPLERKAWEGLLLIRTLLLEAPDKVADALLDFFAAGDAA